MREFIASDLHGSLVHAQRLFEAFERERADRILLLGDLLGHSLFSGDNDALLALFSLHVGETSKVAVHGFSCFPSAPRPRWTRME